MSEERFVPHKLRVQHRNGQIEDLQYVRLLAVDDVPYVPGGDYDDQFRNIENAINDLHHRLQTTEKIVETIIAGLAAGRSTTPPHAEVTPE